MASNFIRFGPHVTLKCGRKVSPRLLNLSHAREITVDSEQKYQIEWAVVRTSGYMAMGSGTIYSWVEKTEVCPEKHPGAHQAVTEWLTRLP
jgi:hypothetical protein